MGIPASTGTISREEIQSVYANTLRKLFCGIALERAVVSAAAPAAVIVPAGADGAALSRVDRRSINSRARDVDSSVVVGITVLIPGG